MSPADWGIWLACVISFSGGLAIGALLMYVRNTERGRPLWA